MTTDHGIDPVTALRAAEILESPRRLHRGLEETDDAIATLDKVLTATPPGPLHITILSNLGLIRMVRYQLTSALADLDAAIHCFREAQAHAARLPEDSHPELSATIPNLIGALHARAEHTGNWEDLDEAIVLGRDAAVRIPPGLPQRSVALASLSSALRIRYERSRYEGDLTEAIDLGRQAGADLPQDHPRQGPVLSNLGSSLLAAGMVEEAVRAYRGAVERFEAAGNRHGLARTLNNLAGALAQAGRTDEAVTLSWQAIDAFRALGDASGEVRVKKNIASFLALWEGAAERDADEARQLYERTLADSVRILGEDDATTRALRDRLAVLRRG
ncbi:tetratricopeptide repeat protein [Streptomyces sp. RS10V-4]|uniref:tetratricopeptide repeat protein n=1 Tax=Streptomyces rhizoryzae TaxID=2932493 RepID=UPI002006BBBF|nr:tetratricopeptide repeat protein [Streptomyces rhizoryzae]MCK7628012.1 tetratricopeptide repeat protein [Streptomyces rhizoryzae]